MASIFSTRTSILAVDLTSAGAPGPWQRDQDPETETFIMARLAGLAKLLDRAGADLITTGGEFRLGGKRRRDDFLDGALALSRLGQHTSSVKFAAGIPLGPATANSIASTVSAVHRSTFDRGGWQVDVPTPDPARGVGAVVAGLRNLENAPTVVVNVRNEVDVEIAAARAHVARLRVNTVEDARNLRSAIRAAATDWGRDADDIRVVIDVHAVLADETRDAESRALFIEEIAPAESAGLLKHAGTVTTLANVWQNWARAGAADGFVIIPGSIPTDIVQIATGLLPEIERRGLRTAVAAPVPAAPKVRPRRQSVAA